MSLRRDLVSLTKRVGGLQETLGAFVEAYSVRRVVEELEKRIAPKQHIIQRNVAVENGELDAIIATDGEVYLVEASGVVSTSGVRRIRQIAEKLQKSGRFPGKQLKPVVAGVRIDKNAALLARQPNIETIYV